MTAPELDLTAAIEAAGGEAVDDCAECVYLNPIGVTLCESCKTVTRNMLEAALPHIREALAQQINDEQAKTFETFDYGPEYYTGMDVAADIVRGEA